MKRKLTACLFVLAIWVLFPVTVWAQETTLTTRVPSSHTLHIDIAGNGEIVVDGDSYTRTGDPVPVTALCFVMVLSFIGLFYCLLLQRKRKY